MAEEFEVVDVWVGLFPSGERLDRYFEESYSEDDDENPISEFAADQGEWFYDHDLLERMFYNTPTRELAPLIERLSFSRSFINAASARFGEFSLGMLNTAVLLFGMEVTKPKSALKDDYQLYYLGRFSSDPKAPPAAGWPEGRPEESPDERD